MLEIIVCDDNALHCKEIVKSVQAALDGTPAEISDFPDAGRLLDYLRSTGCQPHIALLDICMPEQNGIHLARSIKQYAPGCQIIFLSSFLNYATDVYETEHIYFILKSQLHQRIGPALYQALTALGDRAVQIPVRQDGAILRIALQDGESQTRSGDGQQQIHNGQRHERSDQPHLSSGGQTTFFARADSRLRQTVPL